MSDTVYGGNQVKVVPKQAPCGHVPPVFFTKDGKYVVICNARIFSKDAFIDLAPNVWCGRCGWVKVSDKDYEYYRGFDGAQKAI